MVSFRFSHLYRRFVRSALISHAVQPYISRNEFLFIWMDLNANKPLILGLILRATKSELHTFTWTVTIFTRCFCWISTWTVEIFDWETGDRRTSKVNWISTCWNRWSSHYKRWISLDPLAYPSHFWSTVQWIFIQAPRMGKWWLFLAIVYPLAAVWLNKNSAHFRNANGFKLWITNQVIKICVFC